MLVKNKENNKGIEVEAKIWKLKIEPFMTFIIESVLVLLIIISLFNKNIYRGNQIILIPLIVIFIGLYIVKLLSNKKQIYMDMLSLLMSTLISVVLTIKIINGKDFLILNIISLAFLIIYILVNISKNILKIKNKEQSNYVSIKTIGSDVKSFTSGIKMLWFKHKKIAEFIRYFMAGNVVTILQFITLPLLQYVFKFTKLINIDFHFIGPIGGIDRMANLNGVLVHDPYYIFNFTAGTVGSTVNKTLNGISGEYLSHGGLAFFLAMFITLIIAQVITFIIQRKLVFKSNSKLTSSIIWFVIATIIITLGQSALYGLYQPWIYSKLGDNLGGVVASFVQAIITFWVFFPIFKIIFKKEENINL